MAAALEQATRGLDAGELPIGAVVALAAVATSDLGSDPGRLGSAVAGRDPAVGRAHGPSDDACGNAVASG
jgi:hypothetical protein